MSSEPHIYFDGGCKPNPGQMEACIAIQYPGQAAKAHVIKLGYGTNNIAEWSGLVWAIRWARDNGVKKVTIFGDSKLVINQALGLWKMNNEFFVAFFEDFKEMSEGLDLNLLHVPRNSNLAGRYLEHGNFSAS